MIANQKADVKTQEAETAANTKLAGAVKTDDATQISDQKEDVAAQTAEDGKISKLHKKQLKLISE